MSGAERLAAVSRCSRCGAYIAWVETAKGRNLPLDPDPSDSPLEGNFALRDGVAVYVRDDYRMRQFSPSGERLPGSEPVYVAHFATCTAS